MRRPSESDWPPASTPAPTPRAPPATPAVMEAVERLRISMRREARKGRGGRRPLTARQVHANLVQEEPFAMVGLPAVRKACSKIAKREARHGDAEEGGGFEEGAAHDKENVGFAGMPAGVGDLVTSLVAPVLAPVWSLVA